MVVSCSRRPEARAKCGVRIVWLEKVCGDACCGRGGNICLVPCALCFQYSLAQQRGAVQGPCRHFSHTFDSETAEARDVIGSNCLLIMLRMFKDVCCYYYKSCVLILLRLCLIPLQMKDIIVSQSSDSDDAMNAIANLAPPLPIPTNGPPLEHVDAAETAKVRILPL